VNPPQSQLRVTGFAHDEREKFEFTIESFVAGGYLLTIRFSGDGRSNITGAGVWPTIDKAKKMAEATAARILSGATVQWN